MPIVQLLGFAAMLTLMGSVAADQVSISSVRVTEHLRGVFTQYTQSSEHASIMVYDTDGELQAVWRSGSSPLGWSIGPERLLFASPADEGYVYVLGDPQTKSVHALSGNYSERRLHWQLSGGRVFVSCNRVLSDCLLLQFDYPLSILMADRSDGGRDHVGGFLAGYTYDTGYNWRASFERQPGYGYVTFNGRLLSSRACREALLWPSPSGKWVAIEYSGIGRACSQLRIAHPFGGSEHPFTGMVSFQRARQLLEFWQQEPHGTSPNGRWYAVPCIESGTVLASSGSGWSRPHGIDCQESGRVWWHRNSHAYVYENDRGFGMAWVNGNRRQLVLGRSVEFIGWLGDSVVYLTPSPIEVSEAYESREAHEAAMALHESAQDAE